MTSSLFDDPRVHEIYRYWLSKRHDGRSPHRSDIRPGEIGPLVRNINIIEVLREPLRFRHRLVGTAYIEWLGRDATGQFVDEKLYGAASQDVFDGLARIVETNLPFRRVSRLDWNDRKWLMMEAAQMPLIDETGAVNMILCGTTFRRAERAPERESLIFEPLPLA